MRDGEEASEEPPRWSVVMEQVDEGGGGLDVYWSGCDVWLSRSGSRLWS